MSDKQEQIIEAVQYAENQEFANFNQKLSELINQEVQQKLDEKKQELAQSIVKKNTRITENFLGPNIIDQLKRVVDLNSKGYPQEEDRTLVMDNGDRVTVSPDTAKKMVNLFDLYDEQEQFNMQRRMRQSENDFWDIAAAAGVENGISDEAVFSDE